MSYGFVRELEILGIGDPGVPNLERIVFRAKEATDLGDYLMLIGQRTASGLEASDQYYLGGHGAVQPGHIVVLYTGPGKDQDLPGVDMTHVRYMGRAKTVFVPGMAIALIKIGAVTLSDAVASPKPVPQGPPRA